MTDDEARLLMTMLPEREMLLSDVMVRAADKGLAVSKGEVVYRLSRLVERGVVRRTYTSDRVSCYTRQTTG